MDEKHLDERGMETKQVGDSRDRQAVKSGTGDKSKFHVTIGLTSRGGGETADERYPIPPVLIHQGAYGSFHALFGS